MLRLSVVVAVAACSRPAVQDAKRTAQNRDEITALYYQIREWVREAGIVDPAADSLCGCVPSRTPRVLCSSSTVPERCADIASLADAICENAEAICVRATDMPRDEWARDVCGRATKTCHAANQRLCRCSS